MELVGDVSAGISTPSEDWQLSSSQCFPFVNNLSHHKMKFQ